MNKLPVYRSLSTGSENYWSDGPLIFTDGYKTICEEYHAYGVLDMARSYLPHLRDHVFLIISFDVYDNRTFHFHAREDSDQHDIVSQHIEYTDITISLAMYLVGGVLLMKEEY